MAAAGPAKRAASAVRAAGAGRQPAGLCVAGRRTHAHQGPPWPAAAGHGPEAARRLVCAEWPAQAGRRPRAATQGAAGAGAKPAGALPAAGRRRLAGADRRHEKAAGRAGPAGRPRGQGRRLPVGPERPAAGRAGRRGGRIRRRRRLAATVGRTGKPARLPAAGAVHAASHAARLPAGRLRLDVAPGALGCGCLPGRRYGPGQDRANPGPVAGARTGWP